LNHNISNLKEFVFSVGQICGYVCFNSRASSSKSVIPRLLKLQRSKGSSSFSPAFQVAVRVDIVPVRACSKASVIVSLNLRIEILIEATCFNSLGSLLYFISAVVLAYFLVTDTLSLARVGEPVASSLTHRARLTHGDILAPNCFVHAFAITKVGVNGVVDSQDLIGGVGVDPVTVFLV